MIHYQACVFRTNRFRWEKGNEAKDKRREASDWLRVKERSDVGGHITLSSAVLLDVRSVGGGKGASG